METKFTPGPWGVEATRDTLWIGPMRPDGEKLEDIVGRIGCEPDLRPEVRDEFTANAHLISAAPDMYEALEGCCKRLRLCAEAGGNSKEYIDILVEQFEAPLRKARGERP